MNVKTLTQALQYVDSWLAHRYVEINTPGFSVAIRHAGKPVFSKAYGYANLEQKTVLTTEHTFRIASQSKSFTAVAVMQLQEQGKLKIDDPVCNYLTWLKNHTDQRWQNITIRQLLNHSAGIFRDGNEADFWLLWYEFPDAQELQKQILAAALVIENNTQLKYSNFGYAVLGQLVGLVSGMPYGDYVRTAIVEPLNISARGATDPTCIDQLATGYTRPEYDRKRLPIDHVNCHSLDSAAGVYATPNDCAVFFEALMPGRSVLLNEESRKEMRKLHWERTHGTSQDAYGLGMVLEKVGTRATYGHSGGFPGYITRTLCSQQDQLVISVGTNAVDGSAGAIAKGILRVLNWFQDNAATETSNDLSLVKGRYLCLWDKIDLVSSGNTIVMANPSSWDPFDSAPELEFVDRYTFRIKADTGFGSLGELIKIVPNDQYGQHIVYTGSIMLPPEEYTRRLRGDSMVRIPISNPSTSV